jgi:hypothetical protein
MSQWSKIEVDMQREVLNGKNWFFKYDKCSPGGSGHLPLILCLQNCDNPIHPTPYLIYKDRMNIA